MAFTITTAAINVVRSGTSFTIDTTAANLSEDLNTKDFLVLDQTNEATLSNVNFTKTSQTVLTYSGPDIGTDISLEVRRNTPVQRFQIQQFGNKFDSSVYNEEVDRILGRVFEITLFGAGATEFFIPTPQNQAYAATWATDLVRGRTANVLYDEMELMPRLADNETITGTRVFQGAMTVDNTTLTIDTDGSLVANGNLDINSSSADFTGVTNFTRSTPSTPTNNTEVSTTAFVRNAIQTYVLDILNSEIDDRVDDKLVGQISHFRNTPPTNWLICNGGTFSAVTYPKLNTYLGGTTLPNYLGRFILAADGVTYLIGTTGGFADATLVSHTHGVNDPGHVHGGVIAQGGSGLDGSTPNQDAGSTASATTGITIQSAGVSSIGRNMPPYVALNIYIYAGTSQA